MTVFAMDPRRYRQQLPPPPPQVIDLVDLEVIDLVDFEEKINWHPEQKHNGTSRVDDTSTIASETTMEHLEQKMIDVPVYDAVMLCAADTFVAQTRDELLLLADEHLHFVEDREEPHMDFDCSVTKELWFGCLMDAAEEAAEYFTESVVGATNMGHQMATNHILRLEQDRENKQSLQEASKEAPCDVPEIVDVCHLQDQNEEEIPAHGQQEEKLMMLPRKKEDPPASNQENEQDSFPLLEIHVPDSPEEDSPDDETLNFL